MSEVHHLYRWQKLRSLVLARQPLCPECEKRGATTPAQEVDHIVPITAGGDAWDSDNLQALCSQCHARKSRNEARRRGRIAWKGADVDGNPL